MTIQPLNFQKLQIGPNNIKFGKGDSAASTTASPLHSQPSSSFLHLFNSPSSLSKSAIIVQSTTPQNPSNFRANYRETGDRKGEKKNRVKSSFHWASTSEPCMHWSREIPEGDRREYTVRIGPRTRREEDETTAAVSCPVSAKQGRRRRFDGLELIVRPGDHLLWCWKLKEEEGSLQQLGTEGRKQKRWLEVELEAVLEETGL